MDRSYEQSAYQPAISSSLHVTPQNERHELALGIGHSLQVPLPRYDSRIYSNTVNSESGAQGTHWTSHVLLNGPSVCGNDVVRSQP
ncbi:hypothetical protein HYDPIDRAFT_109692 [Hydnomerulius pinastri MD-312]|uniref:Uncharacterized protein n=1 Tax=Hydnomerulius pinastri MD-312 TaxID=994086 RepID=A0A0C9VTP7_9AGAM|nr:hypothetical protein HYDPIDRAFT_115838 [Hydnomerulius pinastri MD-312]KIJ66613.1 hypothetical protein HYDPIDRAFT_109692 [Hydnomerulius pinastri MD-312]